MKLGGSLTWKLVGLELLAVLAVAVAGAALFRPIAPPPVSDQVANYTPEPAPTVRVDGVAVIGESYTAGTPRGGLQGKNWTELARIAMITPESEPVLTLSGRGGSGYVVTGPQGTTFLSEVPNVVRSEAKLVVVSGSRNDMAQPADTVREAAAATYAAAKLAAPSAKLLVVGVPWVNEQVPARVSATNDAVAEAAAEAGATFVDPLAEGWFFGKAAALIGADGVHPTDEGHRYLAEKITPHIQAALAS